MAKGIYMTVDGVLRRVSSVYMTVESTLRSVPSGYMTVDGALRQFHPGVSVSKLEVGSSLYLGSNGVYHEVEVIYQGNPDATVYDSSCDGTWVLLKYVALDQRRWHSSSNNTYEDSEIHAAIDTFIDTLDTHAQAAIKTVKIPYWDGTGSVGYLSTGADGLSTRGFLLSATEVGLSDAVGDIGVDLGYFTSNSGRIWTVGNSNLNWWLRSPTNSTTSAYRVNTSGSRSSSTVTSTTPYARPALILSSTATYDPANLIVSG